MKTFANVVDNNGVCHANHPTAHLMRVTERL